MWINLNNIILVKIIKSQSIICSIIAFYKVKSNQNIYILDTYYI